MTTARCPVHQPCVGVGPEETLPDLGILLGVARVYSGAPTSTTTHHHHHLTRPTGLSEAAPRPRASHPDAGVENAFEITRPSEEVSLLLLNASLAVRKEEVWERILALN